MARIHILAAGAAFTLGVTSVSFAYSGDLELGNAGPSVMMQFDAARVSGADTAPRNEEQGQSSPTPTRHPPPKAVDDEFQRYFDRHYRAHLVLDATAHRSFETQ